MAAKGSTLIIRSSHILFNSVTDTTDGGGGLYCTGDSKCHLVEASVVAENSAVASSPGMHCLAVAATSTAMGCWTDGTAYVSLPCLPGTYGVKVPVVTMTAVNWATQPSSTGTCTTWKGLPGCLSVCCYVYQFYRPAPSGLYNAILWHFVSTPVLQL